MIAGGEDSEAQEEGDTDVEVRLWAVSGKAAFKNGSPMAEEGLALGGTELGRRR